MCINFIETRRDKRSELFFAMFFPRIGTFKITYQLIKYACFYLTAASDTIIKSKGIESDLKIDQNRLRRAGSQKKVLHYEQPSIVEIPDLIKAEEKRRERLINNSEQPKHDMNTHQSCQYVFHVPAADDVTCSTNTDSIQDSRILSMETKLNSQQSRIEQLEEIMMSLRRNMQNLPHYSKMEQQASVDPQPSFSELLQSLELKIEQLKAKLLISENSRIQLQAINHNLTKENEAKQSKVNSLMQEKTELLTNLTDARIQLSKQSSNDQVMNDVKKTFIGKISNLVNTKRILTHRLMLAQKEIDQKEGFLRRCRTEKMKLMEVRHDCKVCFFYQFYFKSSILTLKYYS